MSLAGPLFEFLYFDFPLDPDELDDLVDGELEPESVFLPEDPTFDTDDEDVDPTDLDEPNDPYGFPLPFTDAPDVQQISERDILAQTFLHIIMLIYIDYFT